MTIFQKTDLAIFGPKLTEVIEWYLALRKVVGVPPLPQLLLDVVGMKRLRYLILFQAQQRRRLVLIDRRSFVGVQGILELPRTVQRRGYATIDLHNGQKIRPNATNVHVELT